MSFLVNLWNQFQEFVLINMWFAPLSAVLLPFIEALIPSLPLTILISFNVSIMASAYGNVSGTFYTILLSTIGSFLGMLLIFGIIRLTLAQYFAKKVEDHKYGKMFLNLVSGPNAFLVLIILSNPFLPSSILNYALSLTKTKFTRYVFLTLSSRLIIILFLVFLGSIFNIQAHPLNILWVLLVYMGLLGLWLLWTKLLKKKQPLIETHEKK